MYSINTLRVLTLSQNLCDTVNFIFIRVYFVIVSRTEREGWRDLNGREDGLYTSSTQTQITTIQRILVDDFTVFVLCFLRNGFVLVFNYLLVWYMCKTKLTTCQFLNHTLTLVLRFCFYAHVLRLG